MLNDVEPIPAKDPNWKGLTPYEAAKAITDQQRVKGRKCCAALREVLSGDRQAPDFNKTVLGA